MSEFDWFPDWRGQTVVIIASGPSAKAANVESSRGKARVITINSSWKLAPWADVLYGCDYSWWRINKGVREFAGLKISQDPKCAREFKDIKIVRCDRGERKGEMRFDQPGLIGWGGNGGFHAVNLAAQFGPPNKIVLVGFDMSLASGVHWHGPHAKGLNNPHARGVEKWRKAMDGAHKALAALGITVINASPESALVAYPKMSLEEAMKE